MMQAVSDDTTNGGMVSGPAPPGVREQGPQLWSYVTSLKPDPDVVIYEYADEDSDGSDDEDEDEDDDADEAGSGKDITGDDPTEDEIIKAEHRWCWYPDLSDDKDNPPVLPDSLSYQRSETHNDSRVTDLESFLKLALPSLGYELPDTLDLAEVYRRGPVQVWRSSYGALDDQSTIDLDGLRDLTEFDHGDGKHQTASGRFKIRLSEAGADTTVRVQLSDWPSAERIWRIRRSKEAQKTRWSNGHCRRIMSSSATMSRRDAEKLRETLTDMADRTWLSRVTNLPAAHLWRSYPDTPQKTSAARYPKPRVSKRILPAPPSQDL